MREMKTGLEMLKSPYITAGEIAEILAAGHPPFCSNEPVQCDLVSCKECWLSWLVTGQQPIPKKTEGEVL